MVDAKEDDPAVELKKQQALQRDINDDYDDVLEDIHASLSQFRPKVIFDDSFINLITPEGLVDAEGKVAKEAVDRLRTDHKHLNILQDVPLSLTDVIARVWGPFDYRHDARIDRMRRQLFEIAGIIRVGLVFPADWKRGEDHDYFAWLDIIFSPFDRAHECMTTDMTRGIMNHRIKRIRLDFNPSREWGSLRDSIGSGFAGMNDLIAGLAT